MRTLFIASFSSASLSFFARHATARITHHAFSSFFLRRRKFLINALVAFRDFHTRKLFNPTQIGFFVRRAERNGNAFLPCTGRTANAMHERFMFIRQVVIEHMAYIIHIYATCSNVCSHKHSNLFALKISESFLTAVLALVPVNSGTLDARLFKHAHNFIGTMLCTTED